MKRVRVMGSALALALAGGVATAADPAAAMLGEPAPAFTLKEARSGETFSNEDFRGKWVVLHFGASW